MDTPAPKHQPDSERVVHPKPNVDPGVNRGLLDFFPPATPENVLRLIDTRWSPPAAFNLCGRIVPDDAQPDHVIG